MRNPIALSLAIVILSLIAGPFIGLTILDDAYITLRCSKNFAMGHGLVFNPSEPVESTSSFLYACLIGLLFKISSIKPETLSLLINHISMFAILFFIVKHMYSHSKHESFASFRKWGFYFIAFAPPLYFYAHSGMETLFFSALMFAGFLTTIRLLKQGQGALWVGLFFGLAAIVRMEAVAFAGLAVLFVAFDRKIEKRFFESFKIIVLFALIFFPILAYRWQFYGFPFPNAYYAKVDGGSFSLLGRGLTYTIYWLLATPPAVYVLVAGLKRLRVREERFLGLSFGLSWIFGYIAYTIFVGGDFFAMFRFFFPVMPVIGWMMCDLIPDTAKRLNETKGWSLQKIKKRLVVIVCLSVFLSFANPLGLAVNLRQLILAKAWAQIGIDMKQRFPKETVLYLSPAGAIPYFSELKTYDTLGLTDPVVAHEKIELGKGKAGHEKMNYERVFQLDPDVIFIGPVLNKKTFSEFKELYRLNKQKWENDSGLDTEKLDEMTDAIPFKKSLPILKFLYSKKVIENYQPAMLNGKKVNSVFLIRKKTSADIRNAFDVIAE
jgi:hypothetical protein